VHSGASRQVPAHGNRHTIGKLRRLHGVFRSSARISIFAKFLRALARSSFCLDRTRWPAGPPWRVALCLAQQKLNTSLAAFLLLRR